MTEDLLAHYHRELGHLRSSAAEFAEAHPTIAKRLRLSAETVDDPHVDRLLEGVAFLNARIRTKLDDDFPELTNALLGVLYPHYLAPIPSMAIVQLTGQKDMAVPFNVPKGTELDTEPVAEKIVGGRVISSETCRYRTTADVTLHPLKIESATLAGRPFSAPADPRAGGAAAVLRLILKSRNPDAGFATLGVDSLRFYLAGPTREALATYDLLFRSAVSVMLACSPNDREPVALERGCIRPVGFGRDEGVVPCPPNSFVGYRLLTEYFTFPQKFLFFDIHGLAKKTRYVRKDQLEIYIYLSETVPDLERKLSASAFALGCTPVINLFRQHAEPIEMDGTTPAYRVVADSRRPNATEIYSVDDVAATDGKGLNFTYSPFFTLKHAAPAGKKRLFWHATRENPRADDSGTEVYLSLVDPTFDPHSPADQVLSVDVTCFNRNLPDRLPFSGDRPRLSLTEGSTEVETIRCLTPPTRTLRPPLRDQGRWRLISHLLLNHLSLTDFDQGADALREILRLYDFRDAPDTRALIDGITGVSCRRGTSRAPGPDMGVMVRGVDITLEFEPRAFSDNGLMLFASVLERFLGLYGSINSFTRLTARVKGRPDTFMRWPARAGETEVL